MNYAQLAQLYDKYSPRLVILGFPCNQFGGQEPGTNEEIKKFAISKGVHFDMFAKVGITSVLYFGNDMELDKIGLGGTSTFKANQPW